LNNKQKTISFYKYRAFFRDNGDTTNFLNIVKFLKPYFDNDNYQVSIISFNNNNDSQINTTKCIQENDYLSNVKYSSYKRIFPRFKIIYQILELIVNIFRFIYTVFKYKPDIVYAYSDTPLFLSTISKVFFKYKIVYDKRGDYINEIKYKKESSMKIKLVELLLKYSEQKSVIIYTVSNTYTLNNNTINYLHKYNYFDKDTFYYNYEEMQLKKNSLNLDEKFIFVYSGSSSSYQMIEETVSFFSDFYNVYNNSYFIIASESNHSDFIKYFNLKKLPKGSYSINNMTQSELRDILMIADMAFLLREDLPLNHNSFPTKFAEYLACGVPVLTTKYIYTIVPMVTENELGEIIDLNNNMSHQIQYIYKKYHQNIAIKQHCADYSNETLQWQKKAFDHFKQIDSIN